MHKDILEEDFFISEVDSLKFSRFDIIFKQIESYVMLKTFIKALTQDFALYVYIKNLIKVIDFCGLSEFKNELSKNLSNIKTNIIKESNIQMDLAEIYSEGLNNILPTMSHENSMLRFILFYNRSLVKPIISVYIMKSYLNFS